MSRVKKRSNLALVDPSVRETGQNGVRVEYEYGDVLSGWRVLGFPWTPA